MSKARKQSALELARAICDKLAKVDDLLCAVQRELSASDGWFPLDILRPAMNTGIRSNNAVRALVEAYRRSEETAWKERASVAVVRAVNVRRRS